MAERPEGYGYTAEVRGKIDSKYDKQTATDAMSFIRHHVPTFPEFEASGKNVHENLKDGRVLCQLINALEPGSVKKINESKMAFKQMENIGNFLDAIGKYGVPKSDACQTVDLYENQNIASVVGTLCALGRKAQSKGKHGFGPKESEKNVRTFTDEQLREGQNVIGLQMGSNKGASQAGQNFGKSRAIMD